MVIQAWRAASSLAIFWLLPVPRPHSLLLTVPANKGLRISVTSTRKDYTYGSNGLSRAGCVGAQCSQQDR